MPKTPKDIQEGDAVTFVDEHGRPHNAVATYAWAQKDEQGNRVGEVSCINLVFVSGDSDKKDQYGRQIERSTSVVHKSTTTAPGRYWE